METIQVLIVVVGVVACVAIVSLARFRTRVEELEHERVCASRQEAARQARAEEAAARAAAEPVMELGPPESGPPDGTVVGVHVGQHVIQGKRVLRDAPEALGFVVLEGAELHEGGRSTPLGGRQWLPAGAWMQEL